MDGWMDGWRCCRWWMLIVSNSPHSLFASDWLRIRGAIEWGGSSIRWDQGWILLLFWWILAIKCIISTAHRFSKLRRNLICSQWSLSLLPNPQGRFSWRMWRQNGNFQPLLILESLEQGVFLPFEIQMDCMRWILVKRHVYLFLSVHVCQLGLYVN